MFASAAILTLAMSAPMDRSDWQRETVYAALLVLDWRQTQDIRRHPGMVELNPLIGRHPSAGRVDRYFAASMVAHAAVSWALPEEWRGNWQRATIAAEVFVVGRNACIGLKVRF